MCDGGGDGGNEEGRGNERREKVREEGEEARVPAGWWRRRGRRGAKGRRGSETRENEVASDGEKSTVECGEVRSDGSRSAGMSKRNGREMSVVGAGDDRTWSLAVIYIDPERERGKKET